ncbi:hypothetical protein FD12_GL001228 [Lentilactobacillus rapi DSM 19907 = JCM 15042]|uniref:Uncharacterized protein n=1 Tax=Lentilactobacillus rapi DSM 19907 = JCM 15042 TaxID=1423795 RepID=A0ABR5PB76_9LACO|nr:hypothetical protein FD12_GL001228 [Lentilactobacillus rapi DSM 19907 = JCM 15042]
MFVDFKISDAYRNKVRTSIRKSKRLHFQTKGESPKRRIFSVIPPNQIIQLINLDYLFSQTLI